MEAAEILERQVRDLTKKIETLEADNYGYREKLRERDDTLKERDTRITELEKQVPPEGSVVLNKADGERWNIARESAEGAGGFDKLKAVQTERDNLQKQLGNFRRRETIREAGYKPTMLERLLNGAEFRGEGEGDERVYSVVTKDVDGNETPVPLEDWANSEGISDLLNVARLESQTATVLTPRVIEQAGARKPQPIKAANADELYDQKKSDPAYRI